MLYRTQFDLSIFRNYVTIAPDRYGVWCSGCLAGSTCQGAHRRRAQTSQMACAAIGTNAIVTASYRDNCERSRSSWICLTMCRLVSKKRSTQLARQLSSPRAKRVDGLLVMHLRRNRHVSVGQGRPWARAAVEAGMDALVPAHARQHVDLRGEVSLCLLSLDKVGKLFLRVTVWLLPQRQLSSRVIYDGTYPGSLVELIRHGVNGRRELGWAGACTSTTARR